MVDLDLARGAEANKRRPAVIVSNEAANSTVAKVGHGVLTIVPITSSVERVLSFQVLLPEGSGGLPQDSKAQAEQVRSVDAERVGEWLGRLSDQQMDLLDDALRLHLAL